MRADPFADTELTCNAFLGGRVRLFQPKDGYRAGIDPVLLAASVAARAGQSVLDLGCGAGPAMICLGARTPKLDLTGIEVQPAYARLCERNLVENGLTGRVAVADIGALPSDVRSRQFDHVIANPPYFEPSRRTAAVDPGRDLAQSGDTSLATWVDVGARRLRPGGVLTIVLRIDRLPDLLAPMTAHLGAVTLWPIAARADREARLMLIRGTKGAKGGFRCLAPLILHRGAHHLRDEDDYTDQISAVLRNAAALPFPATG